MRVTKFKFEDIVTGKEGLLKGPFGSDLKKSLYVPKAKNTYKVYLQENILKQDKSKGKHYITDTYFNDKMKRYEVSEGDFIVTCDGTLGRIYQLNNIKEKGIISSSLLRITLNKELVDENFFLYHWSSNIKDPLIRSHDNSVLKHLPGVQAIRGFEIILPELENQKKIGIFLKNIDSKIELNNKINKELEAMAKTLYDYWFVQFDFPNENGKPYKSSGGKMVYNQELKREIPEGWEVKKLDDIISKTGTGLNPRDNFKLGFGDNYYVTIKNIEQGRVVLDSKCDKVDDEALKIINKRSNLQIGDILFTSIQPVGITYLIQEQPKNWNINESVFTVRPDYNLVSSDFLFMLLSSDLMKAYTNNVSAGSIHKGVRHTDLKAFKFAYSGDTIIQNFNRIVQPILKKMYINEQQNQELANLRDWLLPMLMNGQVKVK